MSPSLKKPRKNEKKRLLKLNVFEAEIRQLGYQEIAGVDEVGRGPLAGPVVAACCTIAEGVFFKGVNDSKLLSPKKREELFEVIRKHPGVRFGIGIVDAEEIDKINIYQAAMVAMSMALDFLPKMPDYILVDGKVNLNYKGIPLKKIVGGDRLSQTIAASSIIAKVTRDQMMRDYDKQYPEYKFSAHKGYGTEEHLEILKRLGPCPIHRKSFSPIKDLYEHA